MASKVRQLKGAWWVVTHYDGKRRKRRVGPTKADKRRAEKIAETINAALALGSFGSEEREEPLPCDVQVRAWYRTYSPTLKPSTADLYSGLIETHLAPFFGSRDLREIRDRDLLDYIAAKVADGLKPKTIRNGLSILRRVYNVLEREGAISRNPAKGIGELIRRVDRAGAQETEEVQFWTRAEAEKLLGLAREHEPRFAPMLTLFFSTGLRRGEALGLQWPDVDFEARTLSIRRSVTASGISTPKSGKARRVPMTDALADLLFDVLAERRRETLARGWPEAPAWVFPSEAGTALHPRNVERVWARLRRRAAKKKVRPLKLHCTRHSWATWALQAGKNVRWVADVLGHADPALTLRVYAHAMRDEETDLSFASFDAPGRPHTAPRDDEEISEAASDWKGWHAGRDSNPRPPGSKPGALSS